MYCQQVDSWGDVGWVLDKDVPISGKIRIGMLRMWGVRNLLVLKKIRK